MNLTDDRLCFLREKSSTSVALKKQVIHLRPAAVLSLVEEVERARSRLGRLEEKLAAHERMWAGFAAQREATDALAAKAEAVKGLCEALQAARDELKQWGWGDHHYGSQPQEPSVVAAVEQADAALARWEAAENG